MHIKLSQSDWMRIGREMGWTKGAFGPEDDRRWEYGKDLDEVARGEIHEPDDYAPTVYRYCIEVDEPDAFRASVIDSMGSSIWDVLGGRLLEGDDKAPWDMGQMKDRYDVDGVKWTLVEDGIIDEKDKVVRRRGGKCK